MEECQVFVQKGYKEGRDGRKERIGKTLYIENGLIKKKDIGGVRGRKKARDFRFLYRKRVNRNGAEKRNWVDF